MALNTILCFNRDRTSGLKSAITVLLRDVCLFNAATIAELSQWKVILEFFKACLNVCIRINMGYSSSTWISYDFQASG